MVDITERLQKQLDYLSVLRPMDEAPRVCGLDILAVEDIPWGRGQRRWRIINWNSGIGMCAYKSPCWMDSASTTSVPDEWLKGWVPLPNCLEREPTALVGEHTKVLIWKFTPENANNPNYTLTTPAGEYTIYGGTPGGIEVRLDNEHLQSGFGNYVKARDFCEDHFWSNSERGEK